MSFREWANNHSAIVTIAVAAVLAVALLVVVLQLRTPGIASGRATPAYFWDLETGEVFAASANDMPPVAAPSGGQGVKAHIFTCGECSPDEWFGFLETYTEEAMASMEELRKLDDLSGPNVQRLQSDRDANHLVRPLDDDRWVPMTSDAGMRLQDIQGRCKGGERPKRCQPTD